MAMITTVFSVAKGGLILHKLINSTQYPGMHPEYYACIICHAIFSLIVLLLSVTSGFGLRRLEKYRVKKYYNRLGEEVNSDGSPMIREANLRRLMSLAVPVSNTLNHSNLFVIQ